MEDSKIYIVSFSDTTKYILKESKPEADSRLVALEKELNEFLSKEFPGDTFAYYTTPKVVEITPDREVDFKGYTVLDESAVEGIKKELVWEIKNLHANRKLTQNAPFDVQDKSAETMYDRNAKVY